jgi:hypothetical protein
MRLSAQAAWAAVAPGGTGKGETGVVATTATCQWCGARPVNREHLIPRWLRDLLDAEFGDEDGDGIDISAEMADQGGIRSGRTHSAPDAELVVKAVCQRCNSGWMADLEGQVGPMLGALVRGDEVALDEVQQADIAWWAAKTAVMVGHYMPGSVILGPTDSEEIYKLRQAPLGFHIRLAFRPDVAGSPVLTDASAQYATYPGTTHDVAVEANCFSVTMAIGHFVSAVIGGPGIANLDRWKTGGHLPLMVWPPTSGGLSWPPAAPLVDGLAGLRAFHEAFWMNITNDQTFARPDARRRIPRTE